MKQGISLQKLAEEIIKQRERKKDYIVNTSNLRLESSCGEVLLRVIDNNGQDCIEPLDIGINAHRQIAAHLSIPTKYYEKMQAEDPELLSINVNSWFERSPASRMLRVLDGRARAFLSNRYKRLDHYQIAETVIPVIAQMEDVRFESCEITEDRMYMKAVNPRVQAEVSPGDIVQAGVIISNSEVGLGSESVQPLVYRLVCKNGMIVNEAATKRNHIGRVNSGDENFQLYSAETLEADDHAFLLKVRDTVEAAITEAKFSNVVGMMREAKEAQMNTADVPAIVKLTSKSFGITENEQPGILQHLIEGKDLTLYGLSNAVTRYSQDVGNYDRATLLEGIGYEILTMPPKQWSMINQMAA